VAFGRLEFAVFVESPAAPITMMSTPNAAPPAHRPFWSRFVRELYGQVIIATVVGVLIGCWFPNFGADLKPLGDGFIRLIRMLLAPIIFGTVVIGIAKMDNLKEVGRVGLKALLYFEIVSSAALALGLVVVNVTRPGSGMNIDAQTLDAASVSTYTQSAALKHGWVEFLLNVIPNSIIDAFARSDMLQIILFSVLLGMAMARFREQTRPLFNVIDAALHGLFAIVGIVMRVAPLGALGAMAFTVGKYGIGTLASLGELTVAVYGTCALFIFVVLGAIARVAGFSLTKFLRYIRDEIAIVFATSSSESVLPRMMEKMENVGCAKPIVGLVLPSGYVFNPDGTAVYLTIASIFVAQATNTPLTLRDQFIVLAALMLTSKGSAGVAGAGFITLAGTLATVGKIPVSGIVLLLGIERFINAARAVTNLIGNGVATIVIARWEGEFDGAKAAQVLNGSGGNQRASASIAIDAQR
jgi:aerobic C4-dicarboxylate transport protein